MISVQYYNKMYRQDVPNDKKNKNDLSRSEHKSMERSR